MEALEKTMEVQETEIKLDWNRIHEKKSLIYHFLELMILSIPFYWGISAIAYLAFHVRREPYSEFLFLLPMITMRLICIKFKNITLIAFLLFISLIFFSVLYRSSTFLILPTVACFVYHILFMFMKNNYHLKLYNLVFYSLIMAFSLLVYTSIPNVLSCQLMLSHFWFMILLGFISLFITRYHLLVQFFKVKKDNQNQQKKNKLFLSLIIGIAIVVVLFITFNNSLLTLTERLDHKIIKTTQNIAAQFVDTPIVLGGYTPRNMNTGPDVDFTKKQNQSNWIEILIFISLVLLVFIAGIAGTVFTIMFLVFIFKRKKNLNPALSQAETEDLLNMETILSNIRNQFQPQKHTPHRPHHSHKIKLREIYYHFMKTRIQKQSVQNPEYLTPEEIKQKLMSEDKDQLSEISSLYSKARYTADDNTKEEVEEMQRLTKEDGVK